MNGLFLFSAANLIGTPFAVPPAMSSDLLDYVIPADEHERLELPRIQQLEQLMLGSLGLGVLLAIAVGYLAPDHSMLQLLTSMIIVAAVVFLPTLGMYLQAKAASRKPIRVRETASGLHIGHEFIPFLSVLSFRLSPLTDPQNGWTVLHIRTLRRTHRLYLPRNEDPTRLASRFPHHPFRLRLS